MTMTAIEQRYTPDDLLRLDSEGVFELVDGQLVEKQMGHLANLTAGRVGFVLTGHTLAGNLGQVIPEQTIRCFPDEPELVRRPDVMFISTARLGGRWFSGHFEIAPDIAVEVVSPNDTGYEIEKKIANYQSAGISLIWVIYPEHRKMMVFRPDGSVARLAENDPLTGETVLPDFRVRFGDLLPPAV